MAWLYVIPVDKVKLQEIGDWDHIVKISYMIPIIACSSLKKYRKEKGNRVREMELHFEANCLALGCEPSLLIIFVCFTFLF